MRKLIVPGAETRVTCKHANGTVHEVKMEPWSPPGQATTLYVGYCPKEECGYYNPARPTPELSDQQRLDQLDEALEWAIARAPRE